MPGHEILLHGNPAFFVFGEVNADAICTVLLEALELRLGEGWVGQISSLADIDFFMTCPAVSVVFVHALGHDIDRCHGFEPCFQGPYLEVIFLPRFSAERDAPVLHV